MSLFVLSGAAAICHGSDGRGCLQLCSRLQHSLLSQASTMMMTFTLLSNTHVLVSVHALVLMLVRTDVGIPHRRRICIECGFLGRWRPSDVWRHHYWYSCEQRPHLGCWQQGLSSCFRLTFATRRRIDFVLQLLSLFQWCFHVPRDHFLPFGTFALYGCKIVPSQILCTPSNTFTQCNITSLYRSAELYR